MHYRIINLPEILCFICPLTHRPLFQVPIDQVFPFSLLGLCKENPSCLGILQESSSEVCQQLQNCHQCAFKSLSPGNYYSGLSILSAFSFFTYQLVRIRVWNSFAGHKTAQDRLNFETGKTWILKITKRLFQWWGWWVRKIFVHDKI